MDTLILLAVATQGVMAGALFVEGAVLVPFWRSLPAPAFLDWYREHASLLMGFYAPLEIAATAATIVAAIAGWLAGTPGAAYLAAASALSVLILVSFPLYFKDVNASFAEATIEPQSVPSELARWSRWHWGRTGIAQAAFVATILAALA